MKTMCLILFNLPLLLAAQIGIQTNLLGYTVLPLLFEKHRSIECGIETKLTSKLVLKTSFYDMDKTDYSYTNLVKVREDHLRKYGIRIASKFYSRKPDNLKKMPDGFYIGGYMDCMYGKRTSEVNNSYGHSY